MFLFPVLKFWRYSPLGWLCVLLWNTCEILRVPCPGAPHVFGIIIGAAPQRSESEN